jgi:Transcriptional regulatory protein, C terminal
VIGEDGAKISVNASKERAVLTWLALRAPAVVRSGELIDVLWGDDPPATATKTLQNYVAALRNVLPVGVIETSGGGYRLVVGAADVDVGRFEALARAGHLALEGGNVAYGVDRLAEALGLWRENPGLIFGAVRRIWRRRYGCASSAEPSRSSFSTPGWGWVNMKCWSPSWKLLWPPSRCGRVDGRSSCWRCTAVVARPTRCAPTSGCAKS